MGSWGVFKFFFFLKMWLENEKKYQEECVKNYFLRIFKKLFKKLWKIDVVIFVFDGVGFCKFWIIGVDNFSVCFQIIFQVLVLSFVYIVYNEYFLLEGGFYCIIGYCGGIDDQGFKQFGWNVLLVGF